MGGSQAEQWGLQSGGLLCLLPCRDGGGVGWGGEEVLYLKVSLIVKSWS